MERSSRKEGNTLPDLRGRVTNVFSSTEAWVPSPEDMNLPYVSAKVKGNRYFRGFKSIGIGREGIKATYIIESGTSRVYSEGVFNFPLDISGDTEVGKAMMAFIEALNTEFKKFEKLG